MIRDPITAVSTKHANSGWTLVVILLVALALHVILLSLFTPIPRNVRERSQGSRFTVLCFPQDIAGKDSYELRYWLRFTDPESFLKPDPVNGFSLVRNMNPLSPPAPEDFQHNLFVMASGREIRKKTFFPVRALNDFGTGFEFPVIQHTAQPGISAVVPRYPVWTDEKGNILMGLFLRDEDALKILSREKSEIPTMLRVFLRKGQPPEVQVARSSGNRTLDLLAKRQLAVHLGNRAFPETEKYFTVTWQALPLSGKGGSK